MSTQALTTAPAVRVLTPTRLLDLLWITGVALQLFSSAGLGLSFDEAYYVMWGHHPEWSYLDHPPAIGWLLTLVAGLGAHPLLTRLPQLLCGMIAVGAMTLLMRRAFGSRAARLTAVTLTCSLPVWWSSVLISPDAPLMACWAAALALHLRAIQRNLPLDWVRLGIALGGAMLSKYSAALLVVGLGVHLAIYRPLLLRQFSTWLAPVVALLMFSPVLIWNASRGGASFVFQWEMGARHMDGQGGIVTFLDFVAGQALLAGPFVLLGIGGALVAGWRHRSNASVGLLLITGLLPITVCALMSTRQAVEANWPLPAWLGLLALLCWARPAAARRASMGFLALAAMVILYLQHPWFPTGKDVTTRFFGWSEIAQGVESCAQESGLDRWYVLGDSRRETAEVFYELQGAHEARPTQDSARFFFVTPEVLAQQDAVLLMPMEDATEAQVSHDAQQAHLEVLRACGVVARRHVSGEAIESFALFALRHPR